MKTVALSTIGDVGLRLNASTVDLNDTLAVKHMLESAGVTVNLFDKHHIEEAHKSNILFLKCGVIVNWGGEQTDTLKELINLINNFEGPVFLMSVDQDFVFPNQEREGFETINRPVYFLYSGKNAAELASKQLKDFQVEESIQFYQGVQIGKDLLSKPFLDIEPVYDAVYGGQARRELLKVLEDISKKYSLVTYGGVKKKLSSSIPLPETFSFDSYELRAINSLGKFSFIFNKSKTQWLTPRIFEQLNSNSLVLFDTKWEATKPFWTDKNTFSNKKELLERLEYEPTKEDIEEQHQISLNFDYDSYNQEQISHILPLLE